MQMLRLFAVVLAGSLLGRWWSDQRDPTERNRPGSVRSELTY